MAIKAVIFDLDGVIVSTDEFHYEAWKKISDEEGIPFNHTINNRLRGVSRMESLNIILERAEREYSPEEKQELAERKNEYYKKSLVNLTPDDLLPGAKDTIDELKRRKVKIAIGSSSKNTPTILKQIGLADAFDAIADGNDITHSKPDPEVFLLAASRLDIKPEECLVVEDAEAGVQAAIAGGMNVAAVGDAGLHSQDADYRLERVDEILDLI
ncbi:beta-phosphoglucomutase [Paenibacillus hunanensis]|uniref:beta-phosphoglucomutase n=1 Tax=Paenibacillus hunanensis TaxID=539262 RepID=UPI0020262C85|nr:beta-phosphoglucomutase [Paenibacillus hunanensis]MCL9661287.1 beta-phosphoglucomutase [Paenibacillus hunanensis]WPP43581.1 beta-phosphoglucomutase [Paenibacillus hunanensis]